MFIETTATKKLLKLRKRIRLAAGGTSAGKTISILQILIDMAQSDTVPTLTSVVSESFPHLRRGAIRDFLNILQAHHYYDDNRWSKTEFTYTFETGSKIEFFSADQPGKVRGPRRDRLFVNEANNVPKESWVQLLLRTRQFAYADWNPVTDFFMYEDYGLQDEHGAATSDPDTDFLILTYKDNESLETAIINEIEKRRINKQWFRVYGEGKRGELEGLIFKNWKIIDDIPHEARLERRGLDFGYSVDPSALVDIYVYNGGFILDERLYQKGMSNRQIADFIRNIEQPQTLLIPDSSEPKSIDELSSYGLNVLPAQKGPGSVNQGIQYVQDQQISVTKRSVNLIREQRNYMWKTDKDGNSMNVPEDMWNHGMDAIRYGMESLKPKHNEVHVYKPTKMLQRKHRMTR